MLRSKSKDRAADGAGMYMDKKKMGEFLNDLRNNRPSRPTLSGARPPPPSSFVSKRYSTSNLSQATSVVERVRQTEALGSVDPMPPPRCSSAQSFRQQASNAPSVAGSTMAGRPLARPPSEVVLPESKEGDDELPYLERGQRWLERQEAHSLRRALEDMDGGKDEKKVFEDAQSEAAELVWKHQNPEAPFKNPDAPFKNPDIPVKNPDAQMNYREHLRKGSTHARTTSWAQTAQDIQARQIKRRSRESSASRSVSGGSKSSSAPSSRVPSDSSLKVPGSPVTPVEEGSGDAERQPRKRSVQFAEPQPEPTPVSEPARTGLKKFIPRSRTPSPSKAMQTDLKKEEAQEQGHVGVSNISVAGRMASNAVPTHFRNPFSRARESKGLLSRVSTEPMPTTKPLDRFEIQRNPPSQSRNPLYTSNSSLTNIEIPEPEEEVKMKDGKEIRSDDLRKATSASLRDRSPRLPTPTMVSASPGRPIVSFQKDWKPKEVELKQEMSSVKAMPTPAVEAKPYSKPIADETTALRRKKLPTVSMHTMQVPNRERERTSPPPAPLVHAATEPIIPTVHVGSSVSIPSINVSSAPPIPVIAVNDAPPPIPTFAFNDTPSIPTFAFNDAPSVPSIAVNDTPSISVSAPSIAVSAPTNSVSGSPSTSSSTRPLPTPGSRPGPRHAASAPPGSINRNTHITPTGYAHARGTAGALCENCALPIAGRIVSAAGSRFHPQCFRCHHCSEGLECVAFYPEPESHRLDRVNRIRDRIAGHDDCGGSADEDGDEGLRFYCHLDYHEFFSPRCKSCKTPIEGEVVVACGAEWHVGHFFCAQCGDPFDDKTPFVEKDGYAWCVNCHTNRYSTKCKKCRKPVTDTVVKALGAEWHEGCFCCTECNGRFTDGRYFIRPGGMDPYCPACEERRLKA